MASPTWSTEVSVRNRIFEIFPDNPSTYHPIVINRIGSGCLITDVNQVLTDTDSKKVFISYAESYFESSPCPPANLSGRMNATVEALSEAGRYEFHFYATTPSSPPEDYFAESGYIGSFSLDITNTNPVYWVETPALGSRQGGVGVVRGWACDAESVQVSFDDGPLQTVAYGSARTDTEAACGDVDNGYGLVLAWGILGRGAHTMSTFIDDVEVSSVEFEVIGLDEPYVEGISATYVLENFPSTGKTATIEWSEAEQKFVVVKQEIPSP